MTLTARDVAFSVYGVYRLAMFDKSGMGYLDRSAEGALKSFHAAVIVLPAYVVLLALRLWDQAAGASLPWIVLVEAIAYVVSWTAFPVVMMQIAAALDRQDRYTGFLAAYNWSAVVQMTVYLPAVILAESGLLDPALGRGFVFGVVMALLTYQWFILRTALEVGGLAAAGLVILDLFISALITDFSDGLLR